MFKKLQNLLFEEEEVIEEEYVDDQEEEAVQKPRKVKKPKKVEPVADATQDTVQIMTEKKPVVEEEKPKPLGIQIDELQDNVGTSKPAPLNNVQQPVRPIASQPERTRIVPSAKPEAKSSYEFSPVISPIFGVDESKNVDDVIPTNPKKKVVSDSKIGTVISPMYGINKDAEPDALKSRDIASAPVTPMASSVDEKSAEQQVPNLTLDDILANREVESNDLESTKYFKTDDFDKTIVMNNRNISLFDDDSENK